MINSLQFVFENALFIEDALIYVREKLIPCIMEWFFFFFLEREREREREYGVDNYIVRNNSFFCIKLK